MLCLNCTRMWLRFDRTAASLEAPRRVAAIGSATRIIDLSDSRKLQHSVWGLERSSHRDESSGVMGYLFHLVDLSTIAKSN